MGLRLGGRCVWNRANHRGLSVTRPWESIGHPQKYQEADLYGKSGSSGTQSWHGVDFHFSDVDKKPGILVLPASFNLILVGSVFNVLQGSVSSFN